MTPSKKIIEPQSEPACEECGYCLLGHQHASVDAFCPECGSQFDPAQLWRPAPRPSRRRLVVQVYGPFVVTLAVLLAVFAYRGTRNTLFWPLWSLWIFAILLTGVAQPLDAAIAQARQSAPRISRREVARRIWLPAITIHLVVIILITVITLAIL